MLLWTQGGIEECIAVLKLLILSFDLKFWSDELAEAFLEIYNTYNLF